MVREVELEEDGSSAHAEMHLITITLTGGDHGFLRPRGDAPGPLDPRQGKTQVPPPTRRCTVAPTPRPRHARGSSAHAEMHPASSTPRWQ